MRLALTVAAAVVALTALVPQGAFLVADGRLNLRVVDPSGKQVHRIASWHPPRAGLDGIELAPDRRRAFVAERHGDDPAGANLWVVDLASGKKRLLAHAISPSLSPDGKRLLYIAVVQPKDRDYPLLTALVVRELVTGRTRLIRWPAEVTIGTPPELVTNWSPDGRHAAVFDGHVLRVVDTRTATSVDSQPPPGLGLAPVYLDANTLVVEANCCIGRQRLVTLDLRTGARARFAQISSPVVSVRRLGGARLLISDQLGELVVVSHSDVKLLAQGVYGAAT